MSEARRPVCNLAKGESLVSPIRMGDTHSNTGAVRRMPVDALMRDVERGAVAVEKIPDEIPRKVLLRKGIIRTVSKFRHQRFLVACPVGSYRSHASVVNLII